MKNSPIVALVLTGSALLPAQQSQSDALELPVRELTAFKDGHAYVVREAALPPDAGGRVVLDELPQPVLGTFWPFATDGAEVVSARAGMEQVTVERAAVSLAEVAKANVGQPVSVELGNDQVLHGKLLGVAEQGGKVTLLRLETAAGIQVLPIGRVIGLLVGDGFRDGTASKQERARLELRVEGGGAAARVGIAYVQKGFRWIPGYRVELLDDGKARVRMQATLVNDLLDLEDVTVHLVVGVPKFAFADLVDPVALQRQAADVARARTYGQQQRFSNMLSNALMTQVGGPGQGGAPDASAAPDVSEGETREDLFVYPVAGVTLKKGERLVVPVATLELGYRDVYTLDVAMAPPMHYRRNLQDQRVFELAKELAAPKVVHVLRLNNGTDSPLTTAPALVLQGGQVLAQGHMKYTSPGGSVDLAINPAIDVRVEAAERERRRTPHVRINGDDYTRADLVGTIKLKNTKSEAIGLEVTRRILGLVDAVDHDGEHRQLDLVAAWGGRGRPTWWSWWSWPSWWFHSNGFGECRWSVNLEPGSEITLTANWHYFWR
ncbi:MAG TPA: hypothetical protein ENI87_01850 [bacterium]|nr:hypothetical protein [bacterium]